MQEKNKNTIYHPFNEENFENYVSDYDVDFEDFDDDPVEFSFADIDFSDFQGDFKSNLKKLDHRVRAYSNSNVRRYNKGNKLAKKIQKKNVDKTYKILVPSDRKVIVEGVDKFSLSQKPADEYAKRFGYYKGKKLNMMTLTIDNTGLVDFDLNFFDPDMRLSYLFGNGIDINNKITVAGGTTSYSNLVYNLLANPVMIISAQMTISGTNPTNVSNQSNQTLSFRNQNIAGLQSIEPMNMQVAKDVMQTDSNLIIFNIRENLNRPFVPDGTDIIVYKVLAGNTITINFFYKQVQLKRMVFEECRNARNLL